MVWLESSSHPQPKCQSPKNPPEAKGRLNQYSNALVLARRPQLRKPNMCLSPGRALGVSRDTRWIDAGHSRQMTFRLPGATPATAGPRKLGPSWRNQCARMAQFRILAGTPGVYSAVPYRLAPTANSQPRMPGTAARRKIRREPTWISMPDQKWGFEGGLWYQGGSRVCPECHQTTQRKARQAS